MSNIQSSNRDKNYYKTRFGYIPNDWKLVKLSEVIETLDAGVSVNSDDRPAGEGEYGVLKTSSVNNGKFIPSENKVIKEADIERAKLNPARGSIIISRMNTPELVGEIGYVEKDYKNLFLPDRLWQTTFRSEVSGKWLTNLLTLPFFKNQIGIIATGTSNSMKNITKKDFLSLEIPFPPFPVQQKIASILSTWDKAIELKDRLIELKKEQKKGLMQKLLTGEVRLTGFEDKWEKIKLGDVIEESKERTIENNQHPVLTSSRQGIFLQEEYFSKQVASKDTTGYKIVKKGEFTYRSMSDDGNFVFNRLDDYDIGIVSPAYVVFRIKDINSTYLKEFINSNMFKRYMIKYIQGGTRVSYKYKDLHDTVVTLPSIVEQKAIAQIIDVADENINLLEKELLEIKQQRKGLMQLLLTGKVRVQV